MTSKRAWRAGAAPRALHREPARLSRARRCLATAGAGGILAAGLLVLAAAAAAGALHGGPVTSHARPGTATTLTSAADPSIAGGPVSYAATVRPAPGGGTVRFTDGAAPIAGCAAQPVGSTGTATCQVAYPGAGTHLITAAYSGDAWYAASAPAALTQQVSYRVQQLHSPDGPGPYGPTATITVELLEAAGTGVSGPGITLTVTGLFPRPGRGLAPGGTFTAVNLGLQPCYRLQVSTVGYPPGTYTVSFTAGTDPVTHTAQFTVL